MKAEYEEMTSYSDTPMESAYAMSPYVVDGCAYIYIAVQSDDISEAITFIFNHVSDKQLGKVCKTPGRMLSRFTALR